MQPELENLLTTVSSNRQTANNKCLANTKRPCDCRVLCLHLKSSLCSCAQSISDMTSFSSRDQGRHSMHHASMHVDASCNNGVGQFKPIFQVEGNTFYPIFLVIS